MLFSLNENVEFFYSISTSTQMDPISLLRSKLWKFEFNLVGLQSVVVVEIMYILLFGNNISVI